MHIALVHLSKPTSCAGLLSFRPDGVAVGTIIAFTAFQSLPVPIHKEVQERFALHIRTEPLGPVPLDGKPF